MHWWRNTYWAWGGCKNEGCFLKVPHPPPHPCCPRKLLTSVCTISGRLSLIFFTKLKGPTDPSHSSCRSRTSSAIRVPVRPTPALGKGQEEIRPLGQGGAEIAVFPSMKIRCINTPTLQMAK